MLIRIGGGSDSAGLVHYLQTGQKIGRTKTRDELDQRVVLDGDLKQLGASIDSMNTIQADTERYIHITLGFKEDYLPPEMLRAIADEAKGFFLGAYKPGEMAFYCEAHLPKIKSEINRKGNVEDRYGHFHIVIPKVNNLTGKKDDPLGLMSARFGGKLTTEQIVDAWQEHINNKYGISSPKDEENRRVNFESKADVLARRDGEFDFTGRNREWLQTIRDRMFSKRIETVEEFRALLETFGDVSMGKGGTYFQVKPPGETKNVRLKDYQFTPEFITKTTAEKEAFILQDRERRYLEAQPSRLTPQAVQKVLAEWDLRRREIRFLHTDSKLYKEHYKNAAREQKIQILDQLEHDFYSGRSDIQAAQALLDRQVAYERALTAAFPNRKLNATFVRDLNQIRTAIEAGDEIINNPLVALDALTFSQSTITERDLERYLLTNTADAEQYDAALAVVLAHPSIVVQRDPDGNTIFTTTDIEQTERELIHTVERLVAVKTPIKIDLATLNATLAAERLNAPVISAMKIAPTAPFMFTDAGSFEMQVLDLNLVPSLAEWPTIHETRDERIAREIGEGKSMNNGQKAAYNLLVSDKRIAVVNGAPGTGKSHILKAMREAEEAKGNTVYGAILQGKTAEDLERDSGIKSATIAGFLIKLQNGMIKLDRKSVLVIDEAGMVGSRQMAALLKYVEEAGARLRLVGDVYQLSAVEFGDAFRQISEHCDVVQLTEIMRQKVEWQRNASEELSRHDIEEPLRAYAEHGYIHFAENQRVAFAEVVSKWEAHSTAHPKGSLIVLVATNVERKELNRLIREKIKAAGRLRNEIEVATTDGPRMMAAGEKVMFTANSKELKVKNGTAGEIVKITNGQLHIRTLDGKMVKIPANGAGKEDGNAIEYFYATTVHKSQGMTQDRSIVLASPLMALENILVAMTRHKHQLDIVANQEHFADLEMLIDKLDKSGRKDFSHQAGQDWISNREADNVIEQMKADHAHERVIERAGRDASDYEMQTYLDCRLVLDHLAKSHGVDLSIYGITKDNRGRDRIVAGSQRLTVGDFLTKCLNLDYEKEAKPIMQEVYARQLSKQYSHLRAPAKAQVANNSLNEPLWHKFQQWRAEQAETYKTNISDLMMAQRADRDAIMERTKKERLRIETLDVTHYTKRALKKQVRESMGTAHKDLTASIRERREALQANYKQPPAVAYRDFLYLMILSGRADALAELKRVAFSKDDLARVAEIEVRIKQLQPIAEGTKLTIPEREERQAPQSNQTTYDRIQAWKKQQRQAERQVPVQKTVPAVPAEAAESLEEQQSAAQPAVISVEEWVAAHPALQVRDAVLPTDGKVLYIAPDGRWVQNNGRTVSIRPPIENLQIGDLVSVDRAGGIIHIKNIERLEGKGIEK